MGAFDPSFSATLKVAWDTEFKNNTGLILVLFSSVSTWISDNILNSTDFVGRISLEIPLREMSLSECNLFFRNKKDIISAKEKLRLFCVTGGVPRYLEEINLSQNTDKNIKDLCFTKNGILFSEFDKIFNDIFQKRAPSYRDMVMALADGALTLSELCQKLDTPPGGTISSYLKDLIVAGFISNNPDWDLRSPASKNEIIKYRISDKDKINSNIFKLASFSELKGHEAIIGLQFEALILNNLESVFSHLNIKCIDTLKFGPYYQRKTLRSQPCQIDLLIQGKHELYICEMKTSTYLSSSVIQEVENKIEKLITPKHISIRKALIHCSELDPKIYESEYFDNIISFDELLKE